MRYFTSDNHLGHENIILRFNRGDGIFNSIQHHDSVLCSNWWANVTDEDEVYILGDGPMGDLEKSLSLFAMLPGQKKFVPGNHDRIFSGTNSKEEIAQYWSDYEAAGFEILPEKTEIEISTPKGLRTVLLCHFPYQETELPHDKWAKHRPDMSRKLPLLCGHTHSKNRFSENPLEFNVGVDANDFTPVSETVIVDWLLTLD